MIKLAILHATLPQYLAATSGEADQKNIEIALATDRQETLMAAAGRQQFDALVVDLELLGDSPEHTLASIEEALRPELTLVVYSFAKWDLIERLRRAKRQVLRAPVSARALRSNMIGLIVRNLTANPARANAASNESNAMMRLEMAPPMRRYDDMQLAALQDVRSVVDCECPNQVADLVIALNAFESYSSQCQNRNEKDAQIHRMLARVTGHARAVMEYALKELCAFENIDPDKLVREGTRAAG